MVQEVTRPRQGASKRRSKRRRGRTYLRQSITMQPPMQPPISRRLSRALQPEIERTREWLRRNFPTLLRSVAGYVVLKCADLLLGGRG